VRLRASLAVLVLLTVAGCGLPAGEESDLALGTPATLVQVALPTWAVPPPGPLTSQPLPAELLVWTKQPLTAAEIGRVRAFDEVRSATPIAVGSVPVEGKALVVAGVNPADFRRFTPAASARSDAVWQRVAAGDVAMTEDAARTLRQELGGAAAFASTALPVGAFAQTIPTVDAVVNLPRASQLGMAVNGLVVSVRGDIDVAARRIGRFLKGSTVQDLTEVSNSPIYAGSLVGGSLAEAVGSFTYRWFPDGSVAPDSRWVAASIRTETVPIIGTMTCHKVIFSQLRAALREIERHGLADTIHPGEYAGCYYPRFIERDPTRGLSLHTFGIAFDLNVPGNQRGTVGEIDREVVDIFKRWGFAWGGDWSYTDPMHFELAVLLHP
jgi:hypothetical protein